MMLNIQTTDDTWGKMVMKELELKLDNSWVANAEAWTQSVSENRIESRKLVMESMAAGS